LLDSPSYRAEDSSVWFLDREKVQEVEQVFSGVWEARLRLKNRGGDEAVVLLKNVQEKIEGPGDNMSWPEINRLEQAIKMVEE